MDNAEQYKRYNFLQRRDAEMILKEFSSCLTWSENENILDVGCGPGDVTVEILQPQLPSSASLVGVDINPKMVEFANKNYSSKNIHFILLDFSTKNITEVFQEEQFSKIFSFFCFHWIRDLEQAAKNLRILLRPGGEFLICMVPSHKEFLMYRIMSEMDEWKNYTKDVDNFIPRFHDSAAICEEIRELVISQGLEVVMCEERNNIFSFPDMQSCRGFHEGVSPFVKHMSDNTREQFMTCFMQLMSKNGVITESVSGEILLHYPMILMYGRRSAIS